MSDDIYDDVIITESERVEMMVAIYESADCVRDHNFLPETNKHRPLQQTGNHINFFVKNISFEVFSHLTLCLWFLGCDCVKNRSSRAAAVCLVLLCVLLLTAVIVLCVHIHTKNTKEEKEQLLTKITNLTEERDQLLTKNINLTNERDGLLTKNDNLTKQREQNIIHPYFNVNGWSYYKFSFLYFISSLKKNWTESRRYCTERGADLIIINNREEQVSETNFVTIIDRKKNKISAYVWIGLTDSEVEGRWKWVDGSTLTSGFWDPREPNGRRGENCALTYSPGWADYPCSDLFPWICEKGSLK
uniref:C-type lectin domain-containing protein n=1 Tax=Cyprinus carpio TaxID=7962 RepID=A0A8C1KKA5_CYPCA